MGTVFDLAIIGGGINGCGLARDAAGRGASVYLCEKGDFASATSSWSTKLVHGGLRYLEYYEFRLVREALEEREILWALAPHLVSPLRFVLPHHAGLRPAWLLRLGLFLYDHLGGRKRLPGTRTLDLRQDEAGAPLKPGLFARGFEYSDCRVDDARLTLLNALDAEARGATLERDVSARVARREGGLWVLETENAAGARGIIRARALVNAAGPWVADVLEGVVGFRSRAHVRLVQGSHLVVRRLFAHERAYLFQNRDGRIIFAIPFHRDFTLLGTTDRDYAGDPGAVRISPEETDYLLAAAGEYFATPLRREDVVWSYSGVRPLYDDGAGEARAATRDYVLELDEAAGQAPLLSVFGGKITTYRRLAEAALARLMPAVPALAQRIGWTAGTPLPGGDFPVDGLGALKARLAAAFPALPPALLARYAGAYGTRAFALLEGCAGAQDLGRDFGAGLFEREVDYLVTQEHARTAQDILWRRSKLGLWMPPEGEARLSAHLGA